MLSGYPALTPAYGLGSYGRTGTALTISSPRTRLGSQGRIYAYFNQRGQGQEYIAYLIEALGLKYRQRAQPTPPTPPSTVPNPPTINSLTPSNQTLTVNFTLGSDGGSPITDVEYSINNGASWASSGQTSSPIEITGLTNGVTYPVVIRAKNIVGTSNSSNSISGTPNSTVSPPSAPTINSLTPSNQTLTVNFTLGSDGGSPITDIEYSINNGASWTSSGQTSSPIEITSLTNGVTYPVVIRSKNIVGTSNPSNSISGTPNPPIFRALTSGINDLVNCVGSDAYGNIYFGGQFTDAGGVTANRIAKWNSSTWSALGMGVNDEVFALAFDENNNVYAGGYFTNPGYHVAKWDGSSWSGLGPQLADGGVFALAYDGGGNLYVGGSFTTFGGISANRVAKWNISTSTWSALGNGLNDTVFSLTCDSNGNLYAGGDFTIADGNPASKIAKWDGSTWSALGSGVDSRLFALTVDTNNNLYAGGTFTSAGGISINRIAKWNIATSTWSALGTGMNDTVRSLVFDTNGDLYAGGEFTVAGGISATRIAKWDGSSWDGLITGTNGPVRGLAYASNGNLYLGGGFIIAGQTLASRVASYGSNP